MFLYLVDGILNFCFFNSYLYLRVVILRLQILAKN